MFKKKNKQNSTENKIATQVDQDLIVHNMPQGSSKGGSFSGASSFSSAKDYNAEKKSNNFKVVGGLIIGLGVILVGVLIFLSYRFLIKPGANPEVNIQTPSTTQQNSNSDVVVEEENNKPIATSTEDVEDVDESDIIINDGEVDILISEDANTDISDQTDIDLLVEIADSDSDGLNDKEEAIFSTNILEIDSDFDGYLDLDEIVNGYNPNGAGNLIDNEGLERYYSPVANYSLLYPKAWELSTTNNDYTAIISALDNSLIQVSVQPNTKIQGILTWYAETVIPGVPDSERIKNGTGWTGLMGEDGRNFYMTDGERTNIYVISYIPVISSRIDYPNIFSLMINSFQID
ncbi:MAG TPA: hypothetical protein VFD51_01480 [Patescibacteria group bacterium]|nr:hypothetical protein [Patescibacteria group bacterium]